MPDATQSTKSVDFMENSPNLTAKFFSIASFYNQSQKNLKNLYYNQLLPQVTTTFENKLNPSMNNIINIQNLVFLLICRKKKHSYMKRRG